MQNPHCGTPLGKNVYKIRLVVKSKGRGKSGGMSVITRIIEIQMQIMEKTPQTNIYLLSIYDKAEQADISDKKLKELIADLTVDFE